MINLPSVKAILPALLFFCAALRLLAAAGDVIALDSKNARIEDRDGSAKYEDIANRRCVGFWHGTNVVVTWKFDVPEKGAYRVIVVYAALVPEPGSEIEVNVANQRANGLAKPTKDWGKFEELDLGPVLLRKTGPAEVTVKVTRMSGGHGLNLRAIRLVRE
jgi:hypothetical protein